jgi:hypothetical protein
MICSNFIFSVLNLETKMKLGRPISAARTGGRGGRPPHRRADARVEIAARLAPSTTIAPVRTDAASGGRAAPLG